MTFEGGNNNGGSSNSNNYSLKNEELGEALKIDEIQGFKIDFIKNLGYEFHIFGSGSEILNGEKNLKMGDLDIQIVTEDKKTIIKKLQDGGFKIKHINSNQILVESDGKEYDFHFIKKVKKEDGFKENGYLEGTLFFPESGFKEKNGIKYIKPEITYIMATNSRNLGNKNKTSGINIENEMEGIDEKAIIILDFIEDVIYQKKGKSVLKDKSFTEVLKFIEEFLEENNNVSDDRIEQLKTTLEQINKLSELDVQKFKNDCLKYRKIQKQTKRINRLKDKIDYEEVKRLQGLIGFIEK